MITEIFERLFFNSNRGSRNDVKKRLKLVLAHDRSTLNASTLEKMRKEILIVVSKYVELDTDSLEFSIKTDSRMNALIANLPIRRILHSDTPS
jgi:cell division topological specificity factor